MRLPLLLFCLFQLGCSQPKQNPKSIKGEWYLVNDNYKSGWVIYTLDYLNIENDSITIITSWLNRVKEKVSLIENTLTIGNQSFPAKFDTDSLTIGENKYVREKPSYYSTPRMIINIHSDSCKKNLEISEVSETISVGYKTGSDSVLYYWQGNYYTSLDSLIKELTPIHNHTPQLLYFNILLHRELKMGSVIDLKNALRSIGYIKIRYPILSKGKTTLFCITNN